MDSEACTPGSPTASVSQLSSPLPGRDNVTDYYRIAIMSDSPVDSKYTAHSGKAVLLERMRHSGIYPQCLLLE